MVIGCGEKTVSPTPPRPVLVMPANGATGVVSSDYLRWARSSDFTWGKAMAGTVYPESYHIQVANNMVFHDWRNDSTGLQSDSIKYESVLNDTALSVSTFADPCHIQTFYWRVKIANADGESDWSEVRSFMTVPFIPDSTTLSSPADGQTDVSVTPQLMWNESNRAVSYHLQVSTTSDFGSPVVDDNTLTTTSLTLSTALSNNTVYYWRVSVTNDGGSSTWSPVWSFTTIP
jgi:hypothetical protein